MPVIADELPAYVDKTKAYSFSDDLESIVYYDYTAGTTQRTWLERNEDGQVENAVFQSLNGSEWENISMDTYTYDAAGSQTSDTKLTMVSGEWKPAAKENYSFDSNGNLLLREFYQYQLSSWVGTGTKVERTFDESNRCLTYIASTWVSNDWKPLSSGTFTYQSGNPAESVYQYRNSNTGLLENSSRIAYTYSGAGLPVTELYQSWSGAWKNEFRVLYDYDNTGDHVISKQIQYPGASAAWENLTQYIYEYANGVLSKVTKFDWESGVRQEKGNMALQYSGDKVVLQENGESPLARWEYGYEVNAPNYSVFKSDGQVLTGVDKYQFITNGDDIPQELNTFSWSGSDGDWVAVKSDTWTFDYDNQSERIIFKQSEPDDASSVVTRQVEFIFTPGMTTVKKYPNSSGFEIYPNPVRDAFTIQLSELSDNAVYYIYNTVGRLVAKGKLTDFKQLVHVADLPSGQYIVTVVSGEAKSSTVIIKRP
jgi:hypothetical protein